MGKRPQTVAAARCKGKEKVNEANAGGAFQVGIHFFAQTCECVLWEMCGGGEKCNVGEHVDLTHCHYSSTSSTYPHYEAEELRK